MINLFKEKVKSFESKWVKWLYIVMMVSCVAFLVLGVIFGFIQAQDYSRYRGVYTDMPTFIVIVLITIFVDAFHVLIWNVICEYLNNVHIISKEVSKIAHRNEIRED